MSVMEMSISVSQTAVAVTEVGNEPPIRAMRGLRGVYSLSARRWAWPVIFYLALVSGQVVAF